MNGFVAQLVKKIVLDWDWDWVYKLHTNCFFLCESHHNHHQHQFFIAAFQCATSSLFPCLLYIHTLTYTQNYILCMYSLVKD